MDNLWLHEIRMPMLSVAAARCADELKRFPFVRLPLESPNSHLTRRVP